MQFKTKQITFYEMYTSVNSYFINCVTFYDYLILKSYKTPKLHLISQEDPSEEKYIFDHCFIIFNWIPNFFP